MNFIENESPTKLRGGYYTDPVIARFLTRWVLEAHPKRILEPSCGDGVFFDAIADCSPRGLESVLGFEIESGEAVTAALKGHRLAPAQLDVRSTDFLSWSLARTWDGAEFQAAVGNPPFIRYQYLPAEQQLKAEKVFARFKLTFTKHTNAWVPFVIASLFHLAPGGRLAMVVPSEILHVLHAQSLRTFLAAQCSRVLVIDPTDLWFGRTLQGVVLLLAEKHSLRNGSPCAVGILAATDRRFLDEPPQRCFEQADFISSDALEAKWMPALLTADERAAIAEIGDNPSMHRFAELASVDVGIVTGANEFFLVPDSVVEQYRLQRWAHPMFGRSEHVPGVIYDAATHARNRVKGLPTNFIWFADDNVSRLPKGAKEYIALGESQKLDERYKCRVRAPWYAVPSVYHSPVGMLKRSHHLPRLILNKAKAFTTDTAYRICPERGTRHEDLVASFVNSATALSAELEGRHYGGGVLELVPSEIERLLVPLPRPCPGDTLRRLDTMFRQQVPASDILAAQDSVILGAVAIKRQIRETLLNAWLRLRHRRQRIESASAEQAAED